MTGLVRDHWSSIRLAVLAGSKLRGESILLMILHLVLVCGVVDVWRLLHHIAREYVFNLVAQEAHEALFAA